MEGKKAFVDAIAGAGKTTTMINLAVHSSEKGEIPLILTFQKEDRVHVGKKLANFGYKSINSYRRGVTVFEKKKKDKVFKIYVSNLHSLAYFGIVKLGYSPVLVDEDPFFWKEFMKMERSFNKTLIEATTLGDFLYAGYQIARSFSGRIERDRFFEHPAGKLWLHLAKEENLTFEDLLEFEEKIKDAKFEYQRYISEKELEKPEQLREAKTVVEYTDLIREFENPLDDVSLVLIDEGQDWQEFWIRKIINLYRNCKIIVFGDTNQAVFTSSGGLFPYYDIMLDFGFKEIVNETFRTTKRAPSGAYNEALFYQVRKKAHYYAREGKITIGTTLEDFLEYVLRKKGRTGAIITRTRIDEKHFFYELVERGIPVIRSNEEHKWELLKDFFGGKEVKISYSDIEPFLKEGIRNINVKTDMPINKTSLVEYLLEKKNFEEILDEKFYDFLVHKKEPIRITTVHRAKGKEYDATYLMLRKTQKIIEIENVFQTLEFPVEYVARTRHRTGFFRT